MAGRFLVLTYCVIRPAVSVLEPESVTDFLNKEATLNDEFVCEVRASNLAKEEEGLVHSFILQRISRGAVYSGRGQFGRLGAVGTVYFCLVRNDEGREYSVDEQQQGSFLSQEYIVCFLSEPPDSAADNSTFELFRPELDEYAEILAADLYQQREGPLSADLMQRLAGWRAYAVEYVQRALEISLPCLAPLLHMALLVLPVVVVGDEQQALDICRFYNATSIHQTLQQSALDDSKVLKLPCTYAGETLPSESPANTAVIYLSEGAEPRIDGALPNANELCIETARRLASVLAVGPQTAARAADGTSLKLRRALEELKNRVLQELNVLRRAVRLAEVDHYAAAACAHALVTHPNRELLLDILQREQTYVHATEDARDVLTMLREHFKMPIST